MSEARMTVFTCKKPLIVTGPSPGGSGCIISIPEGGKIGFCGIRLYRRSPNGLWQGLFTRKENLLQWIENDDVQKDDNITPDSVKALIEKVKAAQQKA